MLKFIFSKKAGNILAILAVLIFLVLGLIRLYPFNNELEQILNEVGNDWTSYAKSALDIKHNGILLPSIKGIYAAPGGFLYSYFIALCFLIFGENTVGVYLVQHFLIGLAVALVYWTFRDKMSKLSGLLFLVAMTLFTFLDVYKYYAVRFLSETLMFFTISLFFFCFVKGFEKDRLWLQLISAFLVGINVLVRPNVVLFAPALIFIVAPFYLKRKRRMHLLLFVAVMVLSMSFLGLRNFFACGKWNFLPSQGADVTNSMPRHHPIPGSVDLSRIDTNSLYNQLKLNRNIRMFAEYIRQKPHLFIMHYIKKVLFCFGLTPILYSGYRWRPHWLLMWIGFFAYLFLRRREGKKMALWEISVHAYLGCYYAVLIFYAIIQNYGFRYLIPATNFVLIFPFLAWDRLLTIKKNKFLGR